MSCSTSNHVALILIRIVTQVMVKSMQFCPIFCPILTLNLGVLPFKGQIFTSATQGIAELALLNHIPLRYFLQHLWDAILFNIYNLHIIYCKIMVTMATKKSKRYLKEFLISNMIAMFCYDWISPKNLVRFPKYG